MTSRALGVIVSCTVAVCLTTGCEAPPPPIVSDTTPRVSLRAEAVGCWELNHDVRGRSFERSTPAVTLVRLDTTAADESTRRGARLVQRLDSSGSAYFQDAEGFAFMDTWMADSASDSIRLGFNNGLYGSQWTLSLPRDTGPTDTLRGFSQEFGDVVPPPNYPVRPSIAVRVACTEAPSGT